MTNRATRTLRRAALLLAVLALPLTLATTTAGPSTAGSAPGVSRTGRTAADANPLAGHRWGVYTGGSEFSWSPYEHASGRTKELLGRIALAPKAKWFGHWIPNDQIAGKVKEYVANATGGDPEVLVQMTLFRMVPWEQDACKRVPTRAEQRSYRDWYDRFAQALDDTHAMVVLQPDGPFAACAPGGSKIPSKLISYSARVLSALPHTSVYIEAGAADWPAAGQGGVSQVLKFLIPDGIRYARGFSLNGTHYSATSLEVDRGAAIVKALAARGITGKHFVVNTSGNGQPFEFGHYQGPDPLNAWTCRSRSDSRTCVALGIPPTWHVADRQWGLPAHTRKLAARYADAYVWFGRPWLWRQNQPFVMSRALDLGRTWKYRPDTRMTRGLDIG